MEIKTKFNINDNVWVVSKNKVVQQKIKGVEISADKKECVKTYELLDDEKYLEKDVFKTKEELIDSL